MQIVQQIIDSAEIGVNTDTVTDLTANDERAYLMLARDGNRIAVDVLVRSLMRLVRYWAQHYARTGGVGLSESDDLVSEGSIACLAAIGSYDVTRGTRLATYASPKIRARMAYWLRAQSNALGSRAKCQPIAQRLARRINTVTTPDIDALAAEFNTTPARVASLLALFESWHSADRENVDALPADDTNPESLMIEREAREGMAKRFHAVSSCLTARERYVIAARYLRSDVEVSQAAVSHATGRTRQNVSQLELKALAKMRRHAKRNGRTT